MADMVLEPEVIEIQAPDISELVTEDDTPLDNIFSEKQQRLLTDSLYSSWTGPGENRPFITLANVGMFYATTQQAVVPDVLVSLDVEHPDDVWEKRHRSYFIWEYGKPPEVVIEIVSNKVGGELEHKKKLYARLGIAYYVVFDPEQQLSEQTLQIFHLRNMVYILAEETDLPGMNLGFTLWEGQFQGLEAIWLRWLDQKGNLLLTGNERAEKLAAQLSALGVEPEV
jgi:Uma2 family endonuclease